MNTDTRSRGEINPPLFTIRRHNHASEARCSQRQTAYAPGTAADGYLVDIGRGNRENKRCSISFCKPTLSLNPGFDDETDYCDADSADHRRPICQPSASGLARPRDVDDLEDQPEEGKPHEDATSPTEVQIFVIVPVSAGSRDCHSDYREQE